MHLYARYGIWLVTRGVHQVLVMLSVEDDCAVGAVFQAFWCCGVVASCGGLSGGSS